MFCMLPVMILALFLSLQGALIDTFLKIGIPIAAFLAAGWALHQMTVTPAEVSFRNDRVLIKTFYDAALKSHFDRWHHVIDTKQLKRPPAPAVTSATHGHTKFDFKENDWEDFNLLTELLFEANRLYTLKVSDAISA